MRFVITGEWSRNRLLQTIIVLYCFYVALLWVTNALLYFEKMGLDYASVVSYYHGDAERIMSPRSYAGLLEVSHFHLFAMGMLLLVLTHLVPGPPNRLAERVFMRDTDDTDVEVILGRDGMHFVLPPGGGLQRENLE